MIDSVIESYHPIPGIRRVVLAVDDIERVLRGGPHLRVVSPPRTQVDASTTPGSFFMQRFIDRDRRCLALDIVDRTGGRTAGWAARARRGDRIDLAGSSGTAAPSLPSGALIAGDMSALPAIARILESLPLDRALRIVVESSLRADLDAYFGRGLAGRRHALHVLTPGHFAAEIESSVLDGPVPTAAWFAGETSVAERLREHFAQAWGLAPQRRASTAWWGDEPAAVPASGINRR